MCWWPHCALIHKCVVEGHQKLQKPIFETHNPGNSATLCHLRVSSDTSICRSVTKLWLAMVILTLIFIWRRIILQIDSLTAYDNSLHEVFLGSHILNNQHLCKSKWRRVSHQYSFADCFLLQVDQVVKGRKYANWE